MQISNKVMTVQQLTSLFDSIESAIISVKSQVDEYGANLTSLSQMQQVILAHANETDNSIEFLQKLSKALFEELERVETEGRTTVTEGARLAAETARLQTEVDRLNIELQGMTDRYTDANIRMNVSNAQLQEQEQAIGNMMSRAQNQLQNLQDVQRFMGNNNTTLRGVLDSGITSGTLFENKKRKRDELLDNIQAKINQTEVLRERLGELARERQDIRDMTQAVQSVTPSLPKGVNSSKGKEK